MTTFAGLPCQVEADDRVHLVGAGDRTVCGLPEPALALGLLDQPIPHGLAVCAACFRSRSDASDA